jgi:hypothetical protein
VGSGEYEDAQGCTAWLQWLRGRPDKLTVPQYGECTDQLWLLVRDVEAACSARPQGPMHVSWQGCMARGSSNFPCEGYRFISDRADALMPAVGYVVDTRMHKSVGLCL